MKIYIYLENFKIVDAFCSRRFINPKSQANYVRHVTNTSYWMPLNKLQIVIQTIKSKHAITVLEF